MVLLTAVRDLAVWSGLLLVLVMPLLFLGGHRWRRSSRWGSLLVIGSLAVAAWALQRYLGSDTVFLPIALGVALAVAAPVIAVFPYWNPIGHAAFTATATATAMFLAYAALVLATATLHPLLVAAGLGLLALQLAALGLLVAHTFEIVDAVCRTRWVRPGGPRRVPGYAPMVSLHVPTHNEPPELVIETLNALARLEYPDFEVLVIDNNTCDERVWRPVEAHCLRLGPRFRFFHLLPWPGYKSGALNYALTETDPRAEIVGVVDADYLVEPKFLADLVGHFADPRMGFVQTPQDYRDAGTRGRFGSALHAAYLYFFKVSMAARNERNGIIYAGTMGLIRREALERVGGWNEWCITEDAELSLRLLDAGYDSVYVDRTYGRGLMPVDYAGLKRQRFRWAFGGMQILRMHARRLLLPRSGGGLTVAQRCMYLSGGLQWLNDPLTVAFTAILLVGAGALVSGGWFHVQPLGGVVIVIPALFILFAVLRFLWALRVRVGCTWRQAGDAMTVLLGLTWVVAAACVRGLVSRRGVFLRTPKQGERPTLGSALSMVRWELLIGIACLGAAAGLATIERSSFVSTRAVVVILLAWQGTIYLSAMQTSVWDYVATGAVPMRRATGPRVHLARSSAWLGAALVFVIGALLLIRKSPGEDGAGGHISTRPAAVLPADLSSFELRRGGPPGGGLP